MKKIFHIIMLGFCVWTISSCTRFADPAPTFEDDEELASAEDRRFLYINIDGAIGDAVKQIAPATIASILPHSKYTFSGVSEELSNDGTTWTSTMLGVNESRHHIANTDFTEDQDDQDVHNTNVSYPSIFYRIMTTKPHYRTFAFVANAALLEHVMREAIDKKAFDNDEAVKDHAVDYLKDTKSKFGVINFTSVKAAGLASGFSASNPEYAAALNKVDGYIGEILQAIKGRPNYSKEKWMIVIQSNNGGKNQDQGGDSFPERNIFSIYYYPAFKGFEFKPAITSGARFYVRTAATNKNAAMATNPSYLNMTEEEMTVEFSYIRNQAYTSTSNTFVLGKSTGNNQNANPTNGWFFYHRSNAMAFYCHIGGKTVALVNGLPFSNTQWVHCLAVIKKSGTELKVSYYQNGSLASSSTQVVGLNDRITSSQAFEIGGRPGHNASAPQFIDLSFRNLRVWNKALSEDEVKKHACMDEIDPNLPYLDKLEATYPLTNDLTNAVSGKPDLVANPAFNNDFSFPVYSWNTICSDASSNVIINNVDLAPNVFYWLRMQNKSWTLDGKVLLEQFDQEFYNQ